jgi:hypothetical protein
VLVRYARRPRTLSALFGGIYETEILQATNFAVSIHWTATFWISIVQVQSSRSNWTEVAIGYRVGQIRDRTRSEFLTRKGIIVLRFWNHQIRQELDSVLQAIWFALQQRRSSKPSP